MWKHRQGSSETNKCKLKDTFLEFCFLGKMEQPFLLCSVSVLLSILYYKFAPAQKGIHKLMLDFLNNQSTQLFLQNDSFAQK